MRAITHGDLSAVYDVRATIAFDGSTNRGEIEAALSVVQGLAPSRDVRILDVGCGMGWFLAALAAAGYRRICGIDISAKSLRQAAARCDGSAAILILGDVATAALGDFEVATALNACLGCFGPGGDHQFLKGIFRALVPGGRMLLTYVGPEAARLRVGEYRVRYSAASPLEICSQVRIDSGWLIIHQKIDGRLVPEERIRILSAPVMKRMLARAGFEPAARAETPEIAGALPYVSLVVATRPA